MLLLDEPLSALDAHTKVAVRGELQELLREFGLPTLLVTHDYEDAVAVADRIGVIVDGRLRQLGTPEELLAEPADAFVASFIGANVVRGRATTSQSSQLTEVVLDDRRDESLLTDDLDGEVDNVSYPWDITVGRRMTVRRAHRAECHPRRDRLGDAHRRSRAGRDRSAHR